LAIRALSSLEKEVASAVVLLGQSQNWEFAAYIDVSSGSLIELITRMTSAAADPSGDVHKRIQSGASVIVHHNHLSQESLSSADWNGLVSSFDETFAHRADGTTYWGRVRNDDAVGRVISNYQRHEMNAQNYLSQRLCAQSCPYSSELGCFFRKEVINQAMKTRCFVDYEVSWGSQPFPVSPCMSIPVRATGIFGSRISQHISNASNALAYSL